jgi:hypothetical protein|tara:strand:- start:1769 stop:1885 length:117 start_codon:yes stop_codon:yes gene_type:complete
MLNILIEYISNTWICKYCYPEDKNEIKKMVSIFGEEHV